MALTGFIAVLACPIITPAYDVFPRGNVNESIRLGTPVKAESFSPDSKGRIKVRFVADLKKNDSPEREATIPRECVATEKDLVRVRSFDGAPAKYTATAGDYAGVYQIQKNGSAVRTYDLCVEGNCESNRKYTVAKDCPGGKISGDSCEQPMEVLRVRDYYAFRRKGAKPIEDPFTVDYAGKPVALGPEP